MLGLWRGQGSTRAGRTGGQEEGRRAIEDDLEKGDHVRWNSHGGTAEGTVQRRIASDTRAAGRTVRASEEDPQYEVRSEKSGGTAVHRPSALRKDEHP